MSANQSEVLNIADQLPLLDLTHSIRVLPEPCSGDAMSKDHMTQMQHFTTMKLQNSRYEPQALQQMQKIPIRTPAQQQMHQMQPHLQAT